MPIDLDLWPAEYHAIKAVSAGMIWTMDRECPFKAWLASPWNPIHQPTKSTEFDIGTAAHLAVLEPGSYAERVMHHAFASYQTKEARDIRDEAYRTNKTPLKPAEVDIVNGVQEAIFRHPLAKHLFINGDPEASLTWDWNYTKCKCRPDYLLEDRSVVVDLKTANTVNPSAVSRKMELEGWFVRSAWYLAGVEAATGVRPNHYYYVVVEKAAPHIVEVFEVEDGALMQGEQIIMRALQTFRECMKHDNWPTYSGPDPGVLRLGRPTWATFQHADREEDGDFQ